MKTAAKHRNESRQTQLQEHYDWDQTNMKRRCYSTQELMCWLSAQPNTFSLNQIKLLKNFIWNFHPFQFIDRKLQFTVFWGFPYQPLRWWKTALSEWSLPLFLFYFFLKAILEGLKIIIGVESSLRLQYFPCVSCSFVVVSKYRPAPFNACTYSTVWSVIWRPFIRANVFLHNECSVRECLNPS